MVLLDGCNPLKNSYWTRREEGATSIAKTEWFQDLSGGFPPVSYSFVEFILYFCSLFFACWEGATVGDDNLFIEM